MSYNSGRAARSKGSRKNPAYHSWMALRRRCRDKSFIGYANYGGRGLTVCDRWFESFQSFIDDLGERPEGASIERINNEMGYWCGKCDECQALGRSSNCKWADRRTQGNNKRNNVYYFLDGQKLTRAQLARKLGVDYTQLRDRMDRQGLDAYGVGTKPKRAARYIAANGESHTASEWSAITGLSIDTIYGRMKMGWRDEDIIVPPNGISLDRAKCARILVIEGIRLRLSEWARRVGIPRDRIKARLQRGWTEKEAVFGR